MLEVLFSLETLSSVLDVLIVIIALLIGYIGLYFKTSDTIKSLIVTKIEEAEVFYSDATSAGGEKFQYVVDYIYDIVPTILKPFITKEWISEAVQVIFDKIESYATIALDNYASKFTVASEEVSE